MSKLPTAAESYRKHRRYADNLPVSRRYSEYKVIIDSINYHTAAHAAALKEKIDHLDKDFCHCSAENSDLTSQLDGVRHDNKLLREIVKELEAENKRLKLALYTITRAYKDYGIKGVFSIVEVAQKVLDEVGFDPSKEKA